MASASRVMKRVLVLGAGYVALPAIEYLARDVDTHVTVGTCLLHTVVSVCPLTQREKSMSHILY